MRITEEQMEWATVDRMRDMLVNVHDDYKVTHTYALFTTILCWVMQRVRSNGNGQIDRLAQGVCEHLRGQRIEDHPWNIWTTADRERQAFADDRHCGPFAEFEGFTAARFLTALRNATAHGDARNIKPVNTNELLVGQEFFCSEMERGNITWEGRIVLERRDMRRIGIALADLFCEALARPHEGEKRTTFEADARSIREQAA